MDAFKIQELRAAVLNDLREFIPIDYYRFVRTNEDVAYRDITLAKRLNVEQYTTLQLTPRELVAVWLLECIGLYCHKYESADLAADAAEGITPESIKEMNLERLHDALRRYIAYYGPDEARAHLMPADVPATKEESTANLSPSGNMLDDASQKGYAMDFLTYSKIRSACWPVLAAHIDTPDRETLGRFRAKSEGGMRGVIRHEAIEAKELIEARVNLSLKENAAAVLLAHASNFYLNTTADLPRTKGSPPPIEQGEINKLARLTRLALETYVGYLPKNEADTLMAAFDTVPNDAPAAKLEAQTVKIPSGDEIPGKMPNTTIGKLAIKAAWKIECGTGKRATAKQVIETLQLWVDHKDNPDAVAELTDKIPNGVKWVTSAGKENNYDIGACQKTLETWNKSRA